MRPNNDSFLIWRIRQFDDRKAADNLVEKYYREIYAYSYRQVLKKQLAMDLTQEIFISALQSLSGFQSQKSSFRTWLYRIASRRVADYFRSRFYRMGKQMQSIDNDTYALTEDIASQFEDREAVTVVLNIMGEFNKVTQQILRLRLFAEQSFPQIAKTVGLPEGTVKSRYYKAIEKIRSRLEESA